MRYYNYSTGNPRRYYFYGFITAMVLILLGGFYNLQILQEIHYSEKSEKNSVKVETQIPVRGLIYDRHDKLITDNRPSFSLYLVPAQTKPEAITRLAGILNTDEKTLRKKFRSARRFQPVKIARYVDRETLTLIQENKLDLPGVEWRVEPKRNYLLDRSFAHVLGTLGEIAEQELNDNPDYEAGDVVGKKGIEKAMDVSLRGRKGHRYIKVDALGRTVAEIRNPNNRLPYPGNDLYLTIDSRLQLYADSLFGDRNGSLVAINVRNGEILTLVSKPDYRLAEFTESVKPAVWKELMQDPRKPLFDRAAQATYPPGSTYKMVAAFAALNEEIITPEWSVVCPGYHRIGRRIIKCWKSDGHGRVNLITAIRGSCNVYFYQLGTKIGIDHWSKYSRMFEFGNPTGVELTGEKSGLVPSKRYYDRVYGEGGWTAGMLANIAIGQGELLVTPLQMARFAMILANAGTYFQPHLALKMVDKITREKTTFAKQARQVRGIAPEVFEFIREGMRQVVAGGTGWRAGVWQLTGAGKTGTAQNPHGDSHAWYIGFAPFEEPEIAVAVVFENGGSGGGVAAPIAGQFLQRYFHYQGKFDYAAHREYMRQVWIRQQQQAKLDSLREAGMDETLEIRTGTMP